MDNVKHSALSVVGVSKTFGETQVLKNSSMEIAQGEVHALVGENGSGKSTLVKILAGLHTPDPGGEISVAGHCVASGTPKAAVDAGVVFVHQDLGLVLDMDAMDNMALGKGYQMNRANRINWRKQKVFAEDAIGRLGYSIDVRKPLSSLSISERTAVAIARALSVQDREVHLLVLDEPTANLPAPEVDRLFDVLRRVRDSGVAILFISHHFNEVFSLADRVTVLRDGSVVATEDVSKLNEAQLIELMLGRPADHVAVERAGIATGRCQRFTATGLGGAIIDGLDLHVSEGEVLGIAGITGSGRDELASLIGGDMPRRGVIAIDGLPLPAERPDKALLLDMAYVPSQRATNAILQDHDVRENATISDFSPFTRFGVVDRKSELAEVDALLDRFDVRPRRANADISTLSGGNQQKAMLARAIRTQPRVLLLDEPTQGVDVGAQAQIHDLIRKEAGQGTAVLVCSSVSEELAAVADRVLVLANGRVAKELHAPIDPDLITLITVSTTQEASA